MITYLLFENRIFLNVVPNELHISAINNQGQTQKFDQRAYIFSRKGRREGGKHRLVSENPLKPTFLLIQEGAEHFY